MGQYALGQSVPRSEDPRLLRGGGRFADDRSMTGMAHGYVLRSPHAHAKINGIDTEAAKAAPGVVAVLTGADWDALGWGDVPGDPPRKLRDGSTAYAPPFPALVSDRVRCVGDCVAFVVAESRALAQDAGLDISPATVRNVVADLERLGLVHSPHRARAPSAYAAAPPSSTARRSSFRRSRARCRRRSSH